MTKPEFGPLPPCKLLQDLQDFLPKLREANENIEISSDPESDDDSVVDAKPGVEFDLFVGVFDAKVEASDEELKQQGVIVANVNPEDVREKFRVNDEPVLARDGISLPLEASAENELKQLSSRRFESDSPR